MAGKDKLIFGFKRGLLWYNQFRNEFTNLPRATYYTKTEAENLKDKMWADHRARMEEISQLELADELEIAVLAKIGRG